MAQNAPRRRSQNLTQSVPVYLLSSCRSQDLPRGISRPASILILSPAVLEANLVVFSILGFGVESYASRRKLQTTPDTSGYGIVFPTSYTMRSSNDASPRKTLLLRLMARSNASGGS